MVKLTYTIDIYSGINICVPLNPWNQPNNFSFVFLPLLSSRLLPPFLPPSYHLTACLDTNVRRERREAVGKTEDRNTCGRGCSDNTSGRKKGHALPSSSGSPGNSIIGEREMEKGRERRRLFPWMSRVLNRCHGAVCFHCLLEFMSTWWELLFSFLLFSG